MDLKLAKSDVNKFFKLIKQVPNLEQFRQMKAEHSSDRQKTVDLVAETKAALAEQKEVLLKYD